MGKLTGTLLYIIVLISIITFSTLQIAEAQSSDFLMYKNSIHGYSIQYPSDWLTAEYTEPIFQSYFESPEQSIYGDAVNLYKRFKPDVVLMDLIMPQYDGFYGLEKIRQYDPNSKVIIFSASLTPEYIKILREMKASAITQKPYDMDLVIKLIGKIINGKTIDLTL